MGISRRSLLGGTGTFAALGLGYAAYRQAPSFFWSQLYQDMKRSIPAASLHPTPELWPDTGLHAAWLGHATTLVKIDGFTILTDPVFSDRCGLDLLVGTIGPKRLVQPAMAIGKLPKIDLVLLTHAHFDHWDIPSLKALASQKIAVLCARQTQDLLDVPKWKSVREVGWRESVQLGPLSVRGLEVRHWGARVRTDTYRGYNGYLVESGRYRVLFGGDTAITALFKEARVQRPIDLAVMPIGAYNPWIHAHCNPEEAVAMANMAGAERIMPIHHQSFALGVEPVGEPIERFFGALGKNADRAVAYQIGMQASVLS